MFLVAPRTARKWANRYRDEGPAGMADRSSRPRSMPAKTPPAVVKRIVRLRWRHRLGPVQVGGRLGIPASTVHAVLVRCRINRLSQIDRVTGEPIRRYEHDYPGSMTHVDVTKFGNIPDGGDWRYVGKQQGDRNRAATVARTGAPRSATRGPLLGKAFVHTVIDDHSRVAYAEICTDEKAVTAIGVLQRAVAWFAERGVTVERVLSENGSASGAQLRITDVDGWRVIEFATNTPAAGGQHRSNAHLELRHRRRARCEDRIRICKDTGLTNLPLHDFDQNRIWFALVALAAELTAWFQMLALADHPARRWEPKRLRLQLFSVAGRLADHGRARRLHLATSAPWASLLLAGPERLRARPT